MAILTVSDLRTAEEKQSLVINQDFKKICDPIFKQLGEDMLALLQERNILERFYNGEIYFWREYQTHGNGD